MITRLRQRFVIGVQSGRLPAVTLAVAWGITGIGVLVTRWELAAIGVLLGVSTATVTAVVQVRLSQRADLHTRMRLGELWSLVGLHSGQALPALEGPAISIEGAYALTTLVRDHQPAQVVELGPGASSALLHLAAATAGLTVQVTALEHDDHYVAAVRRLSKRLSFANFHLIPAPLEDHELPGWKGTWYAAGGIDQLPDSIDLLVIDGPPNFEGADNRYPALPLLRHHLRPGALVYVDDTDRPAEHRMVALWLRELPCELVWQGLTFTVLRWTGAGAG